MTPFLQLALALIIIITLAKVGGHLSYLIGQPAVLGELTVGIILGPSVINLLHLPFFSDPHLEETIKHLAEIGVLLLMFLAGLDLHIRELMKSGKVSAIAGVLGMLLPLGLGALTGLLFSMDVTQAIFTGLILSATSVSISAQTLMELKVLRSRVGVGLLGAAVFDDILVLLGLSIFTALVQPSTEGGIMTIVWIIVRMLLFLGLASLLGSLLFTPLSKLVSSLPISRGVVALGFVIALLYGWSAEVLGGMAAITGAFLAGIWLGRTPAKEHIDEGISTIAYAVFVPIFFINIGLSVNARELSWENGLLMLAMVVIAVVGKILGAGYGALLGGFTKRESLQLGIGMLSRGEVGLIVAAVGIELGLISRGIFSAIVGVVIITTLITPPLLRYVFKQKDEQTQTQSPPGGDQS